MRQSLLLIVLLLSVAGGAWGGSPASSLQTQAPLIAVPNRFDFGRRSALDQSSIRHTFALCAASQTPVMVDRLTPSCHCTQAAPECMTDDYGRFTVAPGRPVKIDVTITPSDLAPGDIEKEVYVFAGGESVPVATLSLTGEIVPPVSFSSSILNFGPIPGGQARTLPLTVMIDTGLLTPGWTPHLQCSDPRVRADLVTQAQVRSISGPVMLRQTYRIVLSPSRQPQAFEQTLFLKLSRRETAKTAVWSLPISGRAAARRSRMIGPEKSGSPGRKGPKPV